MNTPASRRSAGSVSFASALAEQSTVSNAAPPPTAYAARHIKDALRRRAVNSPSSKNEEKEISFSSKKEEKEISYSSKKEEKEISFCLKKKISFSSKKEIKEISF